MKKLVLGLCTWVSALPCIFAQEAGSAISYPVENLIMAYGRGHPDAPPVEALANTEVDLIWDGNQLTGEGTGNSARIRLNDALPAGTVITQSGVHRILAALVAAVNESGVYGVVAFPNREQIDPQSKEDLRSPDDKSLKVVIWLTEVSEVRTIAKGERLRGSSGVMSSMHAPLLANSPLIPPADGNPGSLIFKERLDEYLRRLNRHPGRRVEAAISSTDQPGRVVLDYLVSENRPWFVYAQVSNTGTEVTDEFRERIGYVNNQLFNHDDILSLDFVTSAFDTANAAFASYDYPLIFPDKLRGRVFGSWGDFDATVALLGTSSSPEQNERFSGSSWSGGAELVVSPRQIWGYTFEAALGVSFQHMEVRNEQLRLTGEGDMIAPTFTLRTERGNEVSRFSASIGYESNFKDFDQENLLLMGRLDTDAQFDLFRGDLSYSTYLEPLFARFAGEGAKRTTLAHELSFQARGQFVTGDVRVIPQKEMAVGGFFTVRGYPESAVAGDNAFAASLEYRFHVPRALKPATELEKKEGAPGVQEPAPTLFGRPFNFRPPRVLGRPDWDLVIRGFLDAGGSDVNSGDSDRQRREDRSYMLMSTGIGVELQLRQYLSVRADLGYALEEIKTGIPATGTDPYRPGLNDTDAGDSRLHVMVTFVW